MMKYARYYGRLDWRIFPLYDIRDGCCTCFKGAACGKNTGKHPRTANGFKAATSDLDTITTWWRQWPDANIGLQTGIDRAVLDIDPRHGGHESLAELVREYGLLPDTLITLSGGGGEHYHFALDAPLPSNPDIAPGVELKATGAYVILPPSTHHSGNRYEWEASCHPKTTPLAPLPEWIAQKAKQDTRPGPALGDGWAAEWLRTPIQPGGRRGPNGLPRIVGYLRGHGIDCETAVAIVELWDAQNPEPLGADEVRRHVEEMYGRYGVATLTESNKRRFIRIGNDSAVRHA